MCVQCSVHVHVCVQCSVHVHVCLCLCGSLHVLCMYLLIVLQVCFVLYTFCRDLY